MENCLIYILTLTVIIFFVLLCVMDVFHGLLFYIIILPFIHQNLIFHFGVFDLNFSYLMGFIIILVCLTNRCLEGQEDNFRIGIIKYAAIGILLSLIISTALSPMKALGIKDIIKYLYYMGLAIIVGGIVNTEEKLEILLKWWLCSICCIAAGCLLFFAFDLDYVPGLEFEHIEGLSFEVKEMKFFGDRDAHGLFLRTLNSGFGNEPSILAILSVVGIFICLAFIRQERRRQSLATKLTYLAAIGILAIALLFTYTRSAWLVLPVGCVYFFLQSGERGRRWQSILVGGPLLLVLLVILTTVEPFASRFAQTLEPGGDFGRLILWERLVEMIYEKPLFGVGPGVAAQRMGLVAFQEGLTQMLQKKIDPHNVLLTWWAEQGTVGLIALIIFIALALRQVKGDNRNTDDQPNSLVICIRASVIMWTFFVCFHPSFLVWFWILLGISYGMGLNTNLREPMRFDNMVAYGLFGKQFTGPPRNIRGWAADRR